MLAKCIVCYSEKTFTDNNTGEVICKNCGVVLVENTEVSSTPRAFSKEEFEIRNQTGAPTSLARHDMGLSTVISRFDRDASGNALATDMKAIMDRLRTWDHRTQMSKPKDRNLMVASNELNKLKEKLGLTDTVLEKAAYVYRKALAKKLVRGRTTRSLAAASLYAACRELGVQRSLREVADASDVKFKDLSRSYRLLLREFDMSMPVPDSARAIAKISNSLGISEQTARDAVNILEEVRKHGSSAGKEPMGLAGAILYLICIKRNENISQKNIAEAAGVTEVTIRNRAKEVKQNHPQLFD